MREYFLIKQYINNQFHNSTTIPAPANEEHIKELIERNDGIFSVFLVEEETGKKKDLSEALGRKEFKDKNKLEEKIKKNRGIHRYSCSYKFPSFKSTKISILTTQSTDEAFPKTFFMNGEEGKSTYITTKKLETKEIEKIKIKGTEYEKFIGSKYEEAGYNVQYTGIEKEKQDGGIDLIATKEETITLIQCKNWISTDYHKITAKDLRAFMGDCYIYLLENEKRNKKAAFHFIISDEEILSTSAKYYAEKNPHIKVKAINFDKN